MLPYGIPLQGHRPLIDVEEARAAYEDAIAGAGHPVLVHPHIRNAARSIKFSMAPPGGSCTRSSLEEVHSKRQL